MISFTSTTNRRSLFGSSSVYQSVRLFVGLLVLAIVNGQVVIPGLPILGGSTALVTNAASTVQDLAACLPQRRRFSQIACWNLIRRLSEDPSFYWFGDYVQQNCQGVDNVDRNASCFNPLPDGADPFTYKTLGSRLFNTADYKASDFLQNLNAVVDVTFRTVPEIMSGCNSSVVTPGPLAFDVNPSMSPTTSVLVRNPPTIGTNACSLQQLCTIILFDAAAGIRHNVFPNWPRDNRGLNDPSNPYFGPGNPRTEPNIYVWLVYQQTAGQDVPVTEDDRTAYAFNIPNFATENGLTGPVAMTWMVVKGDLYSSTTFNNVNADTGTSMSCPAILEEQLLTREPLTLFSQLGVGTFARMFDYWVEVKFNPAATLAGAATYADTIGNGAVPVTYLSDKPTVRLYPRLVGPTADDLDGKKFTMMLATTSGRTLTNEFTLLLYWMVTDVPGTDLTGGNEVVAFANPSTIPAQILGQMYLLVVEQTGDDIGDASNFIFNSCPTGLEKRCQFSLTRFLRDTNNKLSGMARFRVTNNVGVVADVEGQFTIEQINNGLLNGGFINTGGFPFIG